MILGLALCSTVAFAQTENLHKVTDLRAEKFAQMRLDAAREAADFKGSIFTKDEIRDTLTGGFFDFSSSNMTGIVYGANAKVTEGQQINGTAAIVPTTATERNNAEVLAHTHLTGYWAHYTSTSNYSSTATNHTQIKNNVVDVMGSYAGNDNGFMSIDLYGFTGSGTAYNMNINSYVAFPAVTRAADQMNKLVSVGFLEIYWPGYDRAFIDYKVNGEWHTREIHTDVDAWEGILSRTNYVLPFEMRNVQNVEVRIRIQATHRGGAWGYVWAIDNVAISVNNQTVAGSAGNESFIDGFYGQIPVGMNIPMTYGVNVRNIGTETLPSVRNVVVAGEANDPENWGTILYTEGVDIPAGDIEEKYPIYINERGFVDPEMPIDSNYLGRFPRTAQGTYGVTTLPEEYNGTGLPTEESGLYGYQIWTVYGDSLKTLTYTDTIHYNVTEVSNPAITGASIDGARWSRDNGFIPSGSLFGYQLSSEGWYTNGPAEVGEGDNVSIERHYLETGYTLWVSYTTGDEIPEGYVFRGIEYVPSTDTNLSIAGSRIGVEAYYFNQGNSQLYLQTGCDSVYTLDASGKDVTFTTGYKLPGQNYNAVNLLFPNQPVLQPNTEYLFGYEVKGVGEFAVASNADRYRHSADSTVRLSKNPITAPYENHANLFGYYDVIVWQPEGDSYSTLVGGANIEYMPMIRPIVGPALDVPQSGVSVECENPSDESAFEFTWEVGSNEGLECGGVASVPAGVEQTVYFIPQGNHTVIDSVYMNGTKLQVYNAATGTGDLHVGPTSTLDVNVYEDEEHEYILLERNWYYVVLDGSDLPVNGGVEFSVYAHNQGNVSIDPVAADVVMSLVPNPATNAVKLNLSGVAGMVNCNIIDMSGRVVYNANINAEAEHTLDLSSIPAGAYFVRVTNDLFSKVEKLIIR